MNYLVIYPGRFHIFHLGHKAVYDYLVNKYQPLGGSVYIATSDIQAPITSPFSYDDKVAMLTKMGIPASHILKVANPYSIAEYADNLPDADDTVLIFAVGAKDQQLVKDANGKVIQRPRFNFNPTRTGEPQKVQPLPEKLTQCRPVADNVAYVDVVPTQNFKVRGVDATSASEIRKMYLKGNDQDRNQIITDLYGAPDPHLRDIFDKKLGVTERAQGFIKEARASRHPGAVIILEKMLHLERMALTEGNVDQDIMEGVVETVDVDAIHAEALREHLLSNPPLYEGRDDFQAVRKFLDSQPTSSPIVGKSYLYKSVQATPIANYINIAQFSNEHKLVRLDGRFAYFNINGTIKRFPETGTLSGDALSQIYFFKSSKESEHFNTLLRLKFPEYAQKSKTLDDQDVAEGEVVSFPGKPIPPDLDRARKLAHDLIDAAHNGKGDPTQLTADIRQQLQRMGYRVRGVGRGIELVNARYGFTQLIKDFDYLEEKRIK